MRNVTSEEKSKLWEEFERAKGVHNRAIRHAEAAEYNQALANLRAAEKAYKSCKVPRERAKRG